VQPFSVSVSTTVPAPPAEVHELLDDLGAHRQWTDHFLVDWELIGDPHGVGAKARFRARGAGPNANGEIEVISSTAMRIVEEGRGGKDLARRTRGTYELAPVEDGHARSCLTPGWATTLQVRSQGNSGGAWAYTRVTAQRRAAVPKPG
jgi:hypothetical protein